MMEEGGRYTYVVLSVPIPPCDEKAVLEPECHVVNPRYLVRRKQSLKFFG